MQMIRRSYKFYGKTMRNADYTRRKNIHVAKLIIKIARVLQRRI